MVGIFFPLIADENSSCWGTFVNVFLFFAPLQQYQPGRVGSSQHVKAFIQLAVFSNRTSKSESARVTKMCILIQPFTKQLSGRDVACTLLFLSVVSISSMYAASRSFWWTMELFACCKSEFAPKTIVLSVRFIHSHSLQFFLVSERSGRRSALYIYFEVICTYMYMRPGSSLSPQILSAARYVCMNAACNGYSNVTYLGSY